MPVSRKIWLKEPSWNREDPAGMGALADGFFEFMKFKNFSHHTLSQREANLRFFFQWCEQRGITRPDEVTRPILERYQRYLYYNNLPSGRPLSVRSQFLRLQTIKAFYRWLTRKNHILSNPAADIDFPKLEKRLPRDVLTIAEVEQIMRVPDITTPLGLRDRAILETFYSTGMRRAELLNLRLYDLNPETGVVCIRLGKGKKDRIIPIGDRAYLWIRKYIEDARPKLVMEPDEGSIFLAYNGTPLADGSLGELVRNLLIKSEIGKRGSCHLFRHTMATHMLEGGADIRFIQQMLGHAQLTTTEIYTQVSMRKLREVFMATHPGARLKRKSRETSPETLDVSLTGNEEREKLFSSLVAEEEAENNEE
jgi:integrase/recombinase XerD